MLRTCPVQDVQGWWEGRLNARLDTIRGAMPGKYFWKHLKGARPQASLAQAEQCVKVILLGRICLKMLKIHCRVWTVNWITLVVQDGTCTDASIITSRCVLVNFSIFSLPIFLLPCATAILIALFDQPVVEGWTYSSYVYVPKLCSIYTCIGSFWIFCPAWLGGSCRQVLNGLASLWQNQDLWMVPWH